MKIFLAVISLLAFMNMVVAAENITVEISGIDDKLGGNLMVFVFGNEGFPKKHEKSLLTQTKKVSKGNMTFVFEAPPDNYLAFKVLHDDDANNRVTKNWTGIWPREGLGFSNALKMGAFGPPGFDEAKLAREIALKGITMKIVYP